MREIRDFKDTIVIVANGDISDGGWLVERLNEAHHVVGADGGTRHLYEARILPDVVVGDMDSLSAEIDTWLQANAVQQLRFSSEKDETDLELAVEYAASQFEKPICIVGGFGGRVDHMLANMMLLANPRWRTLDICIATPYQSLFLIYGDITINGRVGDQLSLIPLSDDVQIAVAEGLKWPLDNEILSFGKARGVSNLITSHSVRIVVGRGVCACILTDKNWSR